ncbi:phage head closure protein [Bradyrhizobium manausense]|uniref:Phage head-tail adapter protein n=1 Tax=Bradyrhizobium manausense TaxID=989370 RepID=A0A0R3CZW5_9BRAD|nr:phage head closure protein [Bradyrhizobium manausense]KRQ03081.1 phage head-tail adapter protein [Bradyrhizobium manausense]
MTAAGNLTEKVTLLALVTVPDGAGGSTQSWEPQLTARAEIRVLKSGEAILAGRLQGVETFVATVRYQAAMAAANSTSRLRNERTGKVFNISAITPDQRLQWVDILCQSDEL